MAARRRLRSSTARRGVLTIKRAETWLWTGPVGHLVGGALDFVQALMRYLLARARGKTIR
ncbi:MAG TPA: hypothetical protein VGG98_00570 [Solirubrobacteraceae bacterium]